jgi:hypothetical protein
MWVQLAFTLAYLRGGGDKAGRWRQLIMETQISSFLDVTKLQSDSTV